MKLRLLTLTLLMCMSVSIYAQGRQSTVTTGSTRVVAAGTLVVQGYGDVNVAPDTAVISAGVNTEGETASEAVDANSAAMNEVISTLVSAGVADDDIETSYFNVYPRYHYSNGESRLIGYSATNSINVTLRNISQVGEMLDKLSDSGVSFINGVSFSVSDDQAAKNAALTNAVNDAFNKASILAAASGVSLGAPISIDGTNGSTPIYVPLERTFADSASASVPINPSDSNVAATVTIIYEIQ